MAEVSPGQDIIAAQYNALWAAKVPSGAILMWSGTIATIPAGWNICDGNNSTPNLIDRFVMSVPTAATNPGDTGGAHTKTIATANLPSHTHSFTTGAVGNHGHDIRVEKYGGSNDPRFPYPLEGWRPTTWMDSGLIKTGGAHTHTGTTNATGSGSAIDIRPKYYKLAFIMKS